MIDRDGRIVRIGLIRVFIACFLQTASGNEPRKSGKINSLVALADFNVYPIGNPAWPKADEKQGGKDQAGGQNLS